jgi:hypothetical protein
MDDDLETTEEAFTLIPEEVQEYIYSAEFKASFDKLCADCAIPAEKQTLLRGSLFGFIALLEEQEDLLSTINDTSADDTIRDKIKDWIQANVTEKILTLVADSYISEEDSEDTPVAIQDGAAPVPAAASLASLADRLKQASIAMPSSRAYTSAKDAANALPATETPKPAIDPYHESIDNE